MKPRYLIGLVIIWFVILVNIQDINSILLDYWYFFLIGITGAIVANSTGAGGGIIFIPFFSALGITASETLASSIMIQTFGMTAGAIGWISSINKNDHFSRESSNLQKTILLYSAPAAITGVLFAQYVLVTPPFQMLMIFRVFSIVFGVALLWITLIKKEHVRTKHHINAAERIMLSVSAFLGGLITAWISIGIGEIMAIVLIMRHFPIMLAVSTGVCLSSISVLTAAPYHIIQDNPVWQIVLFAAPAAIIGGSIARFLSFRLGPVRLKIFFATWVLVTGLSM